MMLTNHVNDGWSLTIDAIFSVFVAIRKYGVSNSHFFRLDVIFQINTSERMKDEICILTIL